VRNIRYRLHRALLSVVAIVIVVTVVTGHGAKIQARQAGDSADTTVGYSVVLGHGGYARLATRSADLIEQLFYNGTGLWHMCVGAKCNTKNRDWGSDALTNTLAFRWALTHDPSVLPYLRRLATTAHIWVASDVGSSDTAVWDAVADLREYQVTGSKIALAKAEAAFSWVDSVLARAFAAGSCPQIDYQWPHGRRTDLKTLETGSNYIKAALLLYEITGQPDYLAKAEAAYAIARKYFLSGPVPLYTVYIFDNGKACTLLPGRYYASVNGNMIWAGAELARDSGDPSYLAQAIATAKAVQARLSDRAGVFVDLQADNDIVEPLVEAMYLLAARDHQRFARNWLLRAASAAGSDVTSAGAFGRFFNGPAPTGPATAWQVTGGATLMQAAAALNPGGGPAAPGFWRHARRVTARQALTGPSLRIRFTGRAIAILGAIGDVCCVAGHARVLVDGVQTFDRTGIWQNETSPSIRLPGQILFAWRWPTAGRHTITILPGFPNPREGGSYFRMTGYLIVP
jgi:hypothetical protein